MGLAAATTFGLVIWVVLWSIGLKAFDGFTLTTTIVLAAAAVRLVRPHQPGNRE